MNETQEAGDCISCKVKNLTKCGDSLTDKLVPHSGGSAASFELIRIIPSWIELRRGRLVASWTGLHHIVADVYFSP